MDGHWGSDLLARQNSSLTEISSPSVLSKVEISIWKGSSVYNKIIDDANLLQSSKWQRMHSPVLLALRTPLPVRHFKFINIKYAPASPVMQQNFIYAYIHVLFMWNFERYKKVSRELLDCRHEPPLWSRFLAIVDPNRFYEVQQFLLNIFSLQNLLQYMYIFIIVSLVYKKLSMYFSIQKLKKTNN